MSGPLLLSPRRWGTLMVVTLSLGLIWTYLSRAPSAASPGDTSPASPREGFNAPDFTLDRLDGGQVTLSHLRGKVVMVNLWASWCAPCRIEMPEIERVWQAYQDQGFVVLGVDTTFQDSEPDVVAFVRELKLTFPILLDRGGGTSNRYQLRALPSTFFVDRQGVIRSAVLGAMNAGLIESKVAELVGETQ